MKILIASDSFKGCMSSQEANRQIEKGILRAAPDVQTETFAVSDGGEGMTEAFASLCQGEWHTTRVPDLYGRPIQAKWVYDPNSQTACMEAASVIGLTLYSHGERNPLQASSYGLGLLARDVLAHPEVKKLIIGLGGTGTNDGGMGFAAAFGAVFYDRTRQPLAPCAANLSKIAFIDKRNFRPVRNKELIAACDVSCHLLGSKGATHVFGRQKGLRPLQIVQTEQGMRQFHEKIDQTFHVRMNDFEGSGAAGGLGGMLIGVFHARMQSGIEILEEGGLYEKIRDADYVFSGEGQTDAQSACGKALSRMARIASKADVPFVCVSGALGLGCEKMYQEGVSAMFSTADRAMSFPCALAHGAQKLEQESYNLMRLILAAERKAKQRYAKQSGNTDRKEL